MTDGDTENDGVNVTVLVDVADTVIDDDAVRDTEDVMVDDDDTVAVDDDDVVYVDDADSDAVAVTDGDTENDGGNVTVLVNEVHGSKKTLTPQTQ